MKLYAIATLVILMLLSLAYSQDTYCSLCDNHVACRNDGSWAANCPSGAEALTLSDANINTVLSEHNRVRNLLALGKIPGYKTASKMKPFVSIWLKSEGNHLIEKIVAKIFVFFLFFHLFPPFFFLPFWAKIFEHVIYPLFKTDIYVNKKNSKNFFRNGIQS